MTQKRPSKQDVMTALLTKDPSVFVHFDPRCDGVVLPPHLRRQPRVVLQYGLNMPVPIPDLEVGDDGVGATLSFSRTPTWTFVPWTAVFAVVNEEGQGMLWESEVPREVRDEPREAPPSKPGKADAKKDAKGTKKSARPLLRAVDGGAGRDEKSAAEPRAQELEAPAREGQLSLVGVEAKPVEEKEPAGKPTAEAPEAAAATAAEAAEPAAEPAGSPAGPASGPARPSDEIVEIPEIAAKKKRELPPWLRVVK